MKHANKNSVDLRAEMICKLYYLLPEIFTEGDKIDFEKLQELLSDDIDDSLERYNFTWSGKKQAMKLVQNPTIATLKTNKNKGKNWDTTQNVFIEGDNLEVLKLLQKSYSNKVKLVYIDPPYNTGKDFIYKDNFTDNLQNYLKQSGQVDDKGNRWNMNSDRNGRYHTDWLNMMYPRLKLARNLMAEDGVIFISIDDSEQANLKKICDEIFGENNFLAQVIWERAYSPVNLKKNFSQSHDYLLVYGKDISLIESNGLKRSDDANMRYSNPDKDPRGPWKSSDLSVGPAIEKNIYQIVTPAGREVFPPSGYSWRLSRERFDEFVEDDRIWFGPNGDATPSIKRFLSEVKQTIVPMTIWNYEDVGHSQSASQNLKRLFDNKAYFSYPKPVPLIQRIIELYSNKDSIVLDFFAGSATTAEAVMKMNEEDGGARRFLCVQLPEKINEKEVAYKDGYHTISEIAEKRIDLAGDKIITKNPSLINQLDIGFKVFELGKSNLKKWDDETKDLQEQLTFFEESFEPESRAIDLVYEIMIKQGLDLSCSIKEYKVENTSIFDVAYGKMIVVLNGPITTEIADFIVSQKGLAENSVIVFQDENFVSDSEKLNIIEKLNANSFQYDNILSI